jgi:hypothetical protein
MNTRGSVFGAVGLLALAATAVAVTSAGGVDLRPDSCHFEPDTGTVTAQTGIGELRLEPDGQIGVYGGPNAVRVECIDVSGGGAVPTAANTDTVSIRAGSLLVAGVLGPGRTDGDEAGSPEIEIVYDRYTPSTAFSELVVRGGSGIDAIELGSDASGQQLGFNLNAGSEDDANADVDLSGPVPGTSFSVRTGPGGDVVNAGGAVGFERPPKRRIELNGQGGDDRLTGGDGADVIAGGAGGDALFGARGRDSLDGNRGTDRCVPGPGGGSMRRCEQL